MNIRECCVGMKTMLSENRFVISNISQKGWLKVIERILSITHQHDIDGLFCGVILKNAFPDTFVYLIW